MFAVIETGGKQLRVERGDVVDVELVPVHDDATVRFERVLMIAGDGGTRLGNPVLAGAEVRGRLLSEVRGPKERIFKHKKRKTYRKQGGHRQDLLRVKIEEIVL